MASWFFRDTLCSCGEHDMDSDLDVVLMRSVGPLEHDLAGEGSLWGAIDLSEAVKPANRSVPSGSGDEWYERVRHIAVKTVHGSDDLVLRISLGGANVKTWEVRRSRFSVDQFVKTLSEQPSLRTAAFRHAVGGVLSGGTSIRIRKRIEQLLGLILALKPNLLAERDFGMFLTVNSTPQGAGDLLTGELRVKPHGRPLLGILSHGTLSFHGTDVEQLWTPQMDLDCSVPPSLGMRAIAEVRQKGDSGLEILDRSGEAILDLEAVTKHAAMLWISKLRSAKVKEAVGS